MYFDLYPFTGGRRHLHKVGSFLFYPNGFHIPPLSLQRGKDFAAYARRGPSTLPNAMTPAATA
ncbi:MAG: hypothetical protein ABGX04_18830 [Myxococcales bacterium]